MQKSRSGEGTTGNSQTRRSRERRLQHHAHVVVFLADVLLHEGVHPAGVFGQQSGMAESHDVRLLVKECRDAAPLDAFAHGFGHLVVAHVDRCVAHGRRRHQADARRGHAVARGQEDVARVQCRRIDGRAAIARVERRVLERDLRKAGAGFGSHIGRA
jgi:hypothetical protein